MDKKHYKLGHTILQISMPKDLQIPANMGLFELRGITEQELDGSAESNSQACDKAYSIHLTDNLAPIAQQFLEDNPQAKQILRSNIRIFYTEEKECRLINFEGVPFPYAISIEESPEKSVVWIDRAVEKMLSIDTVFVSVLVLEKVMLRKNAMILHSAYMCLEDTAVLFSAPSGTGKSTQAGLWEKYRGTRQINGDRSLLLREEDGWYAYGWPICGSSEICHNEHFPIRAIVMLHQAKENEIRRLGVAEAMKKLMTQVTINMWNSEFQIQAMDLIQQLIMEVPVYELGCDISEEAVKCLEKVL